MGSLDDLTVKKRQMLLLVADEHLTRKDAFERVYSPKGNPVHFRIRASRIWREIVATLGGASETLREMGLDEVRIFAVLDESTKATKVTIRGEKAVRTPDYLARLKAADQLADIHGIKKSSSTRRHGGADDLPPIQHVYKVEKALYESVHATPDEPAGDDEPDDMDTEAD